MALNRALMSGASAFALAGAALLIAAPASAATFIAAHNEADLATGGLQRGDQLRQGLEQDRPGDRRGRRPASPPTT
jgi:hypothetical protein